MLTKHIYDNQFDDGRYISIFNTNASLEYVRTSIPPDRLVLFEKVGGGEILIAPAKIVCITGPHSDGEMVDLLGVIK